MVVYEIVLLAQALKLLVFENFFIYEIHLLKKISVTHLIMNSVNRSALLKGEVFCINVTVQKAFFNPTLQLL